MLTDKLIVNKIKPLYDPFYVIILSFKYHFMSNRDRFEL